MPTEKTYNWGFVAAGGMARNQARDLLQSTRNKIYAVQSRTEESSRAFAKEFGGKVYLTLEEMLADPQIDIIYVSSPNQLHHPQTKLALQAGKAVLCEKPFTLNAVELADLIATAREHKVLLKEAMWIRTLPVIVKLRQMLAAGAIGELRQSHASFHIDLPYNPAGRIYNLAMGGGSLLDVGIYPMAFTSMLFGGEQPTEIVSQAELAPTGVDKHFGAVFSYPGGRMAHVSSGVDGLFPEDIVAHGTAGKLVVSAHKWWKLSRFSIQHGDAAPEIIDMPYPGGGYLYQAEEMARCLDEGLLESPAITLAESLAIMTTLDRLRNQWGLIYPGE
jgi:dihydrodiol dehydrogenase / D-xylose 1-dehydrogenase (NADP)